MLSPGSVPRTYARLAPMYDLLVPHVASRARQLALSWIDVRDGERVLDVGVGTGLAFRALIRHNPSGWTLGVDRSPAMLRRARQRASTVRSSSFALRVDDARRLRVPAASFDAAYSGYVLDQLPERLLRTVLRELRRVLRPGGRLVLQHMTTPAGPLERAWTWPERIVPGLLGGSRPLAVTPFVRDAGFVGLRRRTVVQHVFPTEVVYAEVPGFAPTGEKEPS